MSPHSNLEKSIKLWAATARLARQVVSVGRNALFADRAAAEVSAAVAAASTIAPSKRSSSSGSTGFVR